MKVLVEFYGIPRLRAGQAVLELSCNPQGQALTLLDVFCDVADQLPDFAQHCLNENGLRDGYIANLNGRRFVSDPTTPISDGECLLILSADAGG